MAKSKDTYISYELDFLEKKAAELKQYVENHPFDKLEDRVRHREVKGGGVIPVVVATIESQISSLTKSLKDYAEIIKVVADMREKEEAKKIQARGDQSISPFESGEF